MSKISLETLLASLPHQVSGLCFDSRKLSRDCVFVAIRGEKADGHRYLEDAAKIGAKALVVADASLVPASFGGWVVETPDTREALNKLASRYFGDPSNKLFTIGVTGTNGKTTTTHLIEACMNPAGRPTGVIGTINHHLLDRVWKTEMTTPDPVEFQKRLSEFVEHGAKAVALEVSSHALRQARVDEVDFDVAVYTNLSRDHLDYHSDMEDYFDAKLRLFHTLLPRSVKPSRTVVVNWDDEYGRRIQGLGGAKLWRYGLGKECELHFEVREQGFGGTKFTLKSPVGAAEFKLKMPGLHNVYNAVGAIGAAVASGVSLEICQKALAEFNGVKGRLETVPNDKGVFVFVDYAHTDGAIETVLHHLRGIREASGLTNKIITVFGCGGDRDKGKRPLMMKAAAKGSDLVVLTSDNPRTEDPEKILDDAMSGSENGALGKTLFRDADRRQGIRKALELARPGDVVLVAGKGHEDYQQIGTVKHPFSDVEVVKEVLS